MWQAQVFTLYPEVFPGPLSKGLYGKALSNNLWKLKVVNIRDAADDKHKTVDDTPYGWFRDVVKSRCSCKVFR